MRKSAGVAVLVAALAAAPAAGAARVDDRIVAVVGDELVLSRLI